MPFGVIGGFAPPVTRCAASPITPNRNPRMASDDDFATMQERSTASLEGVPSAFFVRVCSDAIGVRKGREISSGRASAI